MTNDFLCHYRDNPDLLRRIFELPRLSEIVEMVPALIERVEVYFCPDQLGGNLTPESHILSGDDLLMVRGSFPLEGKPFMLPRSARC